MPRRATVALLVALACGLGLVLVGVVALAVPAGHVRDAAILHGFVDLYTPSRYPVVKAVADLADPVPYLTLGLLIVGVALVRGRRRRAAVVVALLVVTGATTQALKHLLAQPRVVEWLNNSPSDVAWPSGHATAAMTLALCAVLVTPRRLRWLAVLGGGALALGVGYALLVMHWHYPSDVLAGYLVAALWTALAAAGLSRIEAPEPDDKDGRGPRLWPVLTVSAAAAALAVLVARQDAVTIYALERPTLVVGALAIAALAVALPAGASRV